ncbi:hypothetical protein CEXT_86551, partial [Caerostris extrusa]
VDSNPSASFRCRESRDQASYVAFEPWLYVTTQPFYEPVICNATSTNIIFYTDITSRSFMSLQSQRHGSPTLYAGPSWGQLETDMGQPMCNRHATPLKELRR